MTPIAGAPDCPNPNWSEHIVDPAFTSATITEQPPGAVVLIVECTFDEPTSSGGVSGGNASCTQTQF